MTGFRVVVAHPHLELIDEEGRERGDFLAHSWQCTTLSVAWPRSCAPTAVSHSPGGGVGLPEQNNAIRDSDHVLELFREPIGDCGGTARRAHQARMRRLPLLT